jgi:hypothetical protein
MLWAVCWCTVWVRRLSEPITSEVYVNSSLRSYHLLVHGQLVALLILFFIISRARRSKYISFEVSGFSLYPSTVCNSGRQKWLNSKAWVDLQVTCYKFWFAPGSQFMDACFGHVSKWPVTCWFCCKFILECNNFLHSTHSNNNVFSPK